VTGLEPGHGGQPRDHRGNTWCPPGFGLAPHQERWRGLVDFAYEYQED